MSDLDFHVHLAEALAHSVIFFGQQDDTAWGVLRGDFSPSAPPPRNLAQEGKDTLQAQIDLAPQQYASESQYRPLYAQLGTDTLKAQLPQIVSALQQNQPGISDLFNQANLSQRTADVSSVEQLGPRAIAAIRASNPQQTALLDQLNQQATSGLSAGMGLTPEEARYVSEDAASAGAAAGLGHGPSDVYRSTLALDASRRGVQQQRQQFGTQIAGVNQATTADPFMAILGRSSQAPGAGLGLLGQTQAAGASAGPQQFNPFTSYGSDLFNTNYNADAASRIAGSNNAAALAGSALSY
jgi:hypothetical protein